MNPYFDDGQVTLYLGNAFEVLPELGITADLLCIDPPYGETSLEWDRWQDGWPTLAATAATSMWCFGSMRMFLERGSEFSAAGWKLSQDIVWEKHNGTGFARDRFRRVHEHALHWYRGPWRDVHHDVPLLASPGLHQGGSARRSFIPHTGAIAATTWTDDGTRLARSVIQARSMHHAAIHPSQKPCEVLRPLLEYACPPGGLVLDLFAGSGSTLDTARQCGRRAIGIEGFEPYAESAAKRLSQPVLDFEGLAS